MTFMTLNGPTNYSDKVQVAVLYAHN